MLLFLLVAASLTLIYFDSGRISCYGYLSSSVVRVQHPCVGSKQSRNFNGLSTTPNTLTWRHSTSEVITEQHTNQDDDGSKNNNALISITVPPFYNNDNTEENPDDDSDNNPYPSVLHKIHIQTNFLTPQEAATCLEHATQFATSTGKWNQPDTDRHETYSTCDFPIEESEDLVSYLEDIQFQNRMFAQLSNLYGIDTEDMSFEDLFCANYEARAKTDGDDDQNSNNNHDGATMDRLEAHRDGSLLSFTVVLTPPEQFEGGGTFFDALRDMSPSTPEEESVLYAPKGAVRVQNAGDSVMHSGKLLHGGDIVTSGSRTVLVGFVDVADGCHRKGVLAKACRDFGRMDVAAIRHRRQCEKTKQADGQKEKKGWVLKNQRWLPSNSKACIRGYIAAFPSVTHRADPDYQRRRKLEAEDFLLRNILLPADERVRTVPQLPLELFGGNLPAELFGEDGGEITFL